MKLTPITEAEYEQIAQHCHSFTGGDVPGYKRTMKQYAWFNGKVALFSVWQDRNIYHYAVN